MGNIERWHDLTFERRIAELEAENARLRAVIDRGEYLEDVHDDRCRGAVEALREIAAERRWTGSRWKPVDSAHIARKALAALNHSRGR